MKEKEATLHWLATGLFPLKVVGTRFYRNDIARIAKNQTGKNALVFCTASLIPEMENPHDPSAILVTVGSEKIGHLPRDFSLEFRKRLNYLDIAFHTTLCDAIISGGIETESKVYDYIVELDLDLSTVPRSEKPRYPSIERRDSAFVLESEGDGKYFVKVWLGEGVLGHMHKRMTIHSWTTDNWDTINYYVLNSQGIGLGHKLFSVQKAQYFQLFGKSSPAARFRSLNGRNAVIELAAGA